MPDHDPLFKRLLQAFFPDFLEAFVPELHRDLDLKSVQFADKELIRDRGGQRQAKVVDLVARAKFRGGEGFVLVHVEHQARRDRQIGRRLFLYAAWLMERYNLPVYPILLTSYDAPRNAEPSRFSMTVRGCGIVDFRFRVVQLNRMNWRDFLRHRNPAVVALMVKMNVRTPERLRFYLQVARWLRTLRLDREKMGLIVGFVDHYLELTAKEMVAFQRQVDKVSDARERRKIMELMTCWERKGRAEGELAVIKRQLKRRIGALDPAVEKKLSRLGLARLEALAEALLDFTGPQDLDRWLANGRG